VLIHWQEAAKGLSENGEFPLRLEATVAGHHLLVVIHSTRTPPLIGPIFRRSRPHAARRLRAQYHKIQARSTPNRLGLGLCWNLAPAESLYPGSRGADDACHIRLCDATFPPMSQTLTIEYPDRLPDALNMSRGEFERDARMAMAAKMYELGRLSSAEAARMVGLDRVRFLLDLERFGVSAINMDEDELKQEFAHAREAFAGGQ